MPTAPIPTKNGSASKNPLTEAEAQTYFEALKKRLQPTAPPKEGSNEETTGEDVMFEDLERSFRLLDRATQLSVADWIFQGNGEPPLVTDDERTEIPQRVVAMIEKLNLRSQIQIADWAFTRYDPTLGHCHSLEDYRDCAAVEEACSTKLTIRELDFSPLDQEIERHLDVAAPDQDPWQSLSSRQKAFLLSFIKHGNILEAASGICHPANPLLWSRTCPDFAVAFEDVKTIRQDRLYHLAFVVAVHGERLPLFYKGYPVLSDHEKKQMYVTKRDGGLLRFLLSLFSKPESAGPKLRNPAPSILPT